MTFRIESNIFTEVWPFKDIDKTDPKIQKQDSQSLKYPTPSIS